MPYNRKAHINNIGRERMESLGERVLGSKAAFCDWMMGYHPLLGNKRPVELFRTKSGSYVLLDYLQLLTYRFYQN